jgi:cysteinyl-tRNA synthetase
MSQKYLGETLDIHGGGKDLIFPHHENEITQSEAATGKPFVRYWIHNGMLQLGGEKMSKSLGNLVSVEDFLSRHSGDVLRMLILNSSYRSPLTFTDEVVEQSERGLERLKTGLRPATPGAGSDGEIEAALEGQAATAKAGFLQAMDDDFNTPGALAQLFELVRSINQARDAGAGPEALGAAQQVLRELAGVLGLRLEEDDSRQREAGPFIQLLMEIREDLRKAKQYALADRIRVALQELGVTLEDGKAGTTWKAR